MTESAPNPAPSLTSGRRERKKAQTRAVIARAALKLFLERGFDDVGIREIASSADVAVATVFAHFPSKEALVFDEDDDVVASLLTSVSERPEEVGVLDALEDWFLGTSAAHQDRKKSKEFAAFRRLVDDTPALNSYWRATWRRHKERLATELQQSGPLDTPSAEMLATFVIEGFLLATDRSDTAEYLRLVFRTLRVGFEVMR